MPPIHPVPASAHVILVTGSRQWSNWDAVIREFKRLPPHSVIVHGYCKGLDLIAKAVADVMGLPTIDCPAHWSHDTPDWVTVYGPCPDDCSEVVGRAAGMIRNHWMLDTYHPVHVLAFHEHLPSSKGTKGMIRYAERQHVPVSLFEK